MELLSYIVQELETLLQFYKYQSFTVWLLNGLWKPLLCRGLAKPVTIIFLPII